MLPAYVWKQVFFMRASVLNQLQKLPARIFPPTWVLLVIKSQILWEINSSSEHVKELPVSYHKNACLNFWKSLLAQSAPLCSDPRPNPVGFIWEALMIPVCDYWKHQRCFHRRWEHLDNLGARSPLAIRKKLFLIRSCCRYDLLPVAHSSMRHTKPGRLTTLPIPGCPLWQRQQGEVAQTDKTKNKKMCEALECVLTADCTTQRPARSSGMTAWWDSRNKAHRSEGNEIFESWHWRVTTRLEFTLLTK